MADITLTLTAAQVKVLQKLDAAHTAKQVLQTHVDTWLLPYVTEQDVADRKDVLTAYQNATPQVRALVRTDLGLG